MLEADGEGEMIDLTEAAASALQTAMAAVPKPISGLRLIAESGGCSGLKYQMGLVEKAESSDICCESRGVKIFIEPASFALITGCAIDYVERQGDKGFSFDNPQSKCSDGCGKSCC
jgi:iron-sulfur cluster assembly accessory protein